MPPPTAASRSRPAFGESLIIIYKLGKALGQVSAGVALLAFGRGVALERVHHWALQLEHHVAQPWALSLIRALAQLSGSNLRVIAGALVLDGVLSAVEGWALARGFRFARWLVVLTTGSLMPFELLHLLRQPHLGRALLLGVNAAVVAYLVHRVRREPGPRR